MSGGRSLLGRRRGAVWLRTGLIVFVVMFLWLQLNSLSLKGSSEPGSELNDSAAILSMVPAVLHKFLTPRPKNGSLAAGPNGSYPANAADLRQSPNISEIKRNIAQYNLQQTIYNEDTFGLLQNDSVVIVIQVGAAGPGHLQSLISFHASGP